MLLSVDAALDRILEAVREPEPLEVPLAEAGGRVLLRPVHARHDQPPFDASAMDGYAVRAGDVRKDSVLVDIGTIHAGGGFAGTVGPGQCVRIFTGAPLPPGTDAVVMQEQTFAEGDRVTFLVAPPAGKNVRPRGNDFSEGALVAEAGATLTPGLLTLIAAANHSHCVIARPPRLALVATGDELVPAGTPLSPGRIVASNSFGLSAIFAPFCSEIRDHGIVADKREVLDRALAQALAEEPDVLVTTGGASVGDHDFVQDSLIANGVSIAFWRIAMRPGKPLMFGRKGRTLIFGLPGNPVSSLVTATVFVLPAIRALLGADAPRPLHLPLASPLAANGPRRHFLRARFVLGEDGRTGVVPIGETDSSHTSSLAAADCLIIQPEHDEGMEIGDPVAVIPLRWI